ncbi:MAG: SCP2 sterol-binding domain-containing protein [Lachnospiraceae bacterium]|nr:SCP2 sterol-binding domain-containing protein [Lachnospiraceae bacterium]
MASFEEIVARVREGAQKADVSDIDFLAVQINITGKTPGVFYVEVKDHRVSVEPYDYHDRNCAITMTASDFTKMLDGKLKPMKAFATGKLKVDGDLGKAAEFAKLL